MQDHLLVYSSLKVLYLGRFLDDVQAIFLPENTARLKLFSFRVHMEKYVYIDISASTQFALL